MNINNLSLCNLEYDNSIKKIISKIKYENKDFLLKLDKIKIINFEKDILKIKNNYTIKELLQNINSSFEEKLKIKNILDINIEDEYLFFNCFLQNVCIDDNDYDAILYVSHLEFINKKVKCNCYIIQI